MSQCGSCGREKRWLLHNVRHRAAYRRLCTNCLLKSHQGLFCPFCFHVYDDDDRPLLPHERLMCLKCPSISHLSCLPLSHPHSPPSFLCPPCSSPNFSFFNLDSSPDLDKYSASALVAAAKIAALSMSRAAALARLEAEMRVKEAAFAKKRARDALETLAFLSAKEKKQIKDPDSASRHKLSNSNSKRSSILGDGRNGGSLPGQGQFKRR